MPQPTSTDVHINAPLSNILIAYLQNEDAFVAPDIFPMVPVMKRSDLYFKFSKADFFRDEMQVRAPATESAGSGYNLATGSYECTKYALHKDIDDDTRANEDAPLNSDRDAAIFLGQQALIRMDRVWAQKAFVPGVWTGSTTGGDLTGIPTGTPTASQVLQWNVAGSTPIENLRTQIVNLGLSGINPREIWLVLGAQVWQALADHSELVGRLSYNDLRVFTEDKLAALLGIAGVKIARSVVNTANEGAATGAFQYIHGKNALLLHVPSGPSILKPSAGYTFVWRGYLGMQPGGAPGGADKLRGCATVSKFRMPHLKADRVEAEMAFDVNITGNDMGIFFSGVVA